MYLNRNDKRIDGNKYKLKLLKKKKAKKFNPDSAIIPGELAPWLHVVSKISLKNGAVSDLWGIATSTLWS